MGGRERSNSFNALGASRAVTPKTLCAAAEHAEKLPDWIEGRMDKAADWRLGRR